MTLKSFHIVFIVASSLLALGLTAWSWHAYQEMASSGYLIMAIVSALALLALIIYGPWFWRSMRRLQAPLTALLVGAITALPEPLWACAVCFGDPNALMTKGARYGVFALVTIVAMLLVGIALIAWRWQQRA